jgi:hypothetical protein
MHFIYFAKKKIERFYDFLVERTEESTKKIRLGEGEAKSAAKGKASLGSILAALSLASVEVEAEVSASGKVSLSKEVLSQFTPAQKLKALLCILDRQGRLSDLNALVELGNIPSSSSSVVFKVPLQTDTDRRSEPEIERIRAAVLTGHIGAFALMIHVSLQYMESENQWRRLLHRPVPILGFGTLMTANRAEEPAQVDLIVLAYSWD